MIVLDCDGVVLDSNRMKTDAFREALSVYDSQAVELFLKYQMSSFGRSRYRLFQDFFNNFLERPAAAEETAKLLDTFGQICSQKYLEVPYTDGALAALDRLSRKHDLYIASGSQEAELNRVFKHRGANKFFKGIFGSPTHKSEILKALNQLSSVKIFVGDSAVDFESARVAAVPFCFMTSYSSDRTGIEQIAREEEVACVPNLLDFENYVETLP